MKTAAAKGQHRGLSRNPLYLGNYLVLLGVVLAIKVWWFVLLACLVLALYYERIICAEETFLQQKFGKAYTDWAARTPVFIPKPWRWRRPELPFSLRTVLRREYNGLFFIVVAFPLIEPIDDVLFPPSIPRPIGHGGHPEPGRDKMAVKATPQSGHGRTTWRQRSRRSTPTGTFSRIRTKSGVI